jgi:hypothetical protein
MNDERPTTWRWADDGDRIAGTLTGLSWAPQKEEYGGGHVPVLTIDTDDGPRGVFLSGRLRENGRPTGLWGAVSRESVAYGDRITITRGEEASFTAPDSGTEINYRKWQVTVARRPGTFADVTSGPALPGPEMPAAPRASASDADIPFSPSRV